MRTIAGESIDFAKRNALIIMGVGCFVAFWMLVYTFAVYRPSYAAKSVVIIKDSAITSRYVEPEQYYVTPTTSSSSSNPVLNTMGILKSGAISDAVYAYFKEKHPEQLRKNHIDDQADWEKFFQDGSSFIKAKNTPGTDLIAIQFSWSDPIIAKEALDVVVKAFQETSRDLNKEEQVSKTKFLDKEAAEIATQLQQVRNEKSAYQSQKRTVSVKREGDDLAGSRMELENRLAQIESQARGKENLVRKYEQMLGMTPEKALHASALGQNPALAKMQDEQYRLQQVYSQLSSSLTDTNPKVLEVKAQIDQVKANIEAEKARTMGTIDSDSVVTDPTRNGLVTSMLTAQSEALDLRSQAAVIRGRLGQVNGEIQTFPEVAEGLASIEQREAALSMALDHLRQKVLEGKLKEEQTLSNVFIVDAPRMPDKSQFPTRTHLIVLSMLLGLGAGLAAAFGKEQFLDAEFSLPGRSQSSPWWEPVEETPTYLPRPEVYTTARPHPAVQPQAVPQPVYRPQPQPAPVQPAAARQAVMAPQPPVEKVETPVAGSLFDSLVPVAGPMAAQARPEPLRRDLMQPLPRTAANGNSKPAAPVSQPAASLPPQPRLVTQPTRPQQLFAEIPQTAAPRRSSKQIDLSPPADTPASSSPRVRQAKVPASIPARETARPAASLQAGVPSMHAAPVIEDQPARRSRSLPSFLLDENDGEAPKKQLLSAEDNLLEEVAPVGPPSLPIAMQGREPLKVSSFWFKKRPDRNPESYFGLNPRGRTSDLPGSLDRRMQETVS